MSIKAIALDDENVQHLIIGLKREDVDTILKGDVLVLPPGMPKLGTASDIVVLFAETNEQLANASGALAYRPKLLIPRPT